MTRRMRRKICHQTKGMLSKAKYADDCCCCVRYVLGMSWRWGTVDWMARGNIQREVNLIWSAKILDQG